MIDFKTTYRKYKIANILGEKFDDKDFLKMIDHIKKNLINPDFKQFVDDSVADIIWYGLSRDDIYIEQNLKSNTFWLDYNKIWSFFETEFGYNSQEIRDLTGVIVREHYKLKEVTTYYSISFPKRYK